MVKDTSSKQVVYACHEHLLRARIPVWLPATRSRIHTDLDNTSLQHVYAHRHWGNNTLSWEAGQSKPSTMFWQQHLTVEDASIWQRPMGQTKSEAFFECFFFFFFCSSICIFFRLNEPGRMMVGSAEDFPASTKERFLVFACHMKLPKCGQMVYGGTPLKGHGFMTQRHTGVKGHGSSPRVRHIQMSRSCPPGPKPTPATEPPPPPPPYNAREGRIPRRVCRPIQASRNLFGSVALDSAMFPRFFCDGFLFATCNPLRVSCQVRASQILLPRPSYSTPRTRASTRSGSTAPSWATGRHLAQIPPHHRNTYVVSLS